jgi:ribosome-associated protein
MNKDYENFEREVLEAISDLDGNGINVFDNDVNSDICQRVIIASFLSNKQVLTAVGRISSIAKDYEIKAKCPGRRKHIDVEWVAIDCGDLIIHLFKDDVREYYQLDKFFIQGE